MYGCHQLGVLVLLPHLLPIWTFADEKAVDKQVRILYVAADSNSHAWEPEAATVLVAEVSDEPQ